MQSGRARTASYAHGRSASVACGLGQLRSLSDLARRAHNPARAASSGSSTSAAASGWTALSSASSWAPPGACGATCSLGASRRERASAFFKGRSRATLKIHSEIHSRGVHVFYSGSGRKSTLLATKPKRVGPGVVSLRKRGLHPTRYGGYNYAALMFIRTVPASALLSYTRRDGRRSVHGRAGNTA